MEAIKKPEITDKFFQQEPFIIKLKNGELNYNKLDEIYKKSNSFKNNIQNCEIFKENYDISFEREANFVTIKFYKKTSLIYNISEFLLEPKTVIFHISTLNIESIKIFSFKAYSYLKVIFSNHEKYSFKENEKDNIIELEIREFSIPDDIIDIFLKVDDNYKNYNTAINLVNNIEINPIFLSSNFYHIFPEVERNTNFELILNDERKILLKKLKMFIENDKEYYWLIGSDGIGKSITLLYFSSLKDYKVLYFNLKLYITGSKEKKFHQFFYKDMHKLYLKDIKTREYKDSINFNFSQDLKRIEETIGENFDSNISLFWNYLYNYINLNLGKNDYIIILDQYKSDKYDPKFKGLNKIVNLILAYKQKIKIILSTSINNTESKENLIKNLDNIYNIESNQISLEQILEIGTNNSEQNYQIYSEFEEDKDIQFTEDDEFDNKSDCSFCQNMIINEQKKYNKKIINEEKENIGIISNCILDQIFSKTQRDYFCSLVSGKEIYKKLLENNDEYIMAKNFNYSLKYITKYLNFKRSEKTKGNEIISDIINKFYKKESEKMKMKIRDFFQEIGKNALDKSNCSNGFDLEFNSLCKLRFYIIEEYLLRLSELSNEIYYFPMKYLNISLFPLNINYISLNKDLSEYKFRIQYNNNFSRIQINCIINDIFKNVTNFSFNSFGGSALGNFLEIKIDETFKNNIYNKFGFYNYNCRNLFSLVPNTANSPKTIEKHRKNEKNLITLFFGEEYYNKIIDDIDKENINDINYFVLDKDLYYFSQISFTGRAFDMAIIKKEHDNIFILFLFQVSKSKQSELKSKIEYILEANQVVNNLKNIYGIEINRMYLTFILPQNIVTDKFQAKLKSKGLNYIFFDLYTNKFIDNLNKLEINTLELKESLLDYNPKINIHDLQNIIASNNIWEKSIKKFLNRKLTRYFFEGEEKEGNKNEEIKNEDKSKINNNSEKIDSLHKIYINNLFNSKQYEQIKLIIPKDLETKIKKEIIDEENIKLKFLNNFDIVNINELKKFCRNLIIFSKNQKIYFYYEYFYLFENNEFIKVIDENDFNKKILMKKSKRKNISKSKKKDNIKEDKTKNLNKKDNALKLIREKIIKIDLKDLNDEKYDGKCFFYLIINNNYIKRFFDN